VPPTRSIARSRGNVTTLSMDSSNKPARAMSTAATEQGHGLRRVGLENGPRSAR
jgi:hypothetical protein